MKTRIISAIIALSIFIPLFIIGGIPFKIAIIIVSILGLKELLHVNNSPLLIKIISYLVLVISLAYASFVNTYILDTKFIIGMLFSYIIPVILYQNEKKYNIINAFSLFGEIMLLILAFSTMIIIRDNSLLLLIYLFLIAMSTDTFALLFGMKFGKTKLVEKISPKKTVEGLIGGLLVGTTLSSCFYLYVIDLTVNPILLIIVTLLLAILAEFGDLAFSAIKRHYNIKDFSNIMPGHGGVLDRVDSILFILLGYILLMGLL